MSTINWVAFGAQMAVMVLFPVALAIIFHRRLGAAWRVYFIAAGFYLINLVVQMPFVYAANAAFAKSLPWVALALTALIYGVSEETLRYLSFRAGRTMRANRTANGALMAGVGHGGTESMLFALSTAATTLMALLAPAAFDANAAASGSTATAADILGAPSWTFLGGGLSRILAIAVHLAFATLIVMAYRRSWLFYPLAILAHFAVDFSAFGVQMLTDSLGWTLVVFADWAILALVLLLAVRRTALNAAAEAPSDERAAVATI
jgi:uncharacterized membrane protein YhfC